MKYLRNIATIVFFLAVAQPVYSEEGCGTCILYGKDHAFALTAPRGWILDNKSGVSMGLHQVFYPEGESFQKSSVFAYTIARTKTPQVSTVKAQVAATLDDFRTESPNISASFSESLKLPNGRKAEVYYYTGDKWGNYEVAGYIEEKKTINFVVLSAKNKADFDRSLEAFRSILLSYTFVSDNVDIQEEPKPKGLSFAFAGHAPDFPQTAKMNVGAGVVPGIPVLFDDSESGKVTLRPATNLETSNDIRPIYRFEWQEDNTAMFYKLYEPSRIERLLTRNAHDSSSPEGKSYERDVVTSFFDNGRVLQTCISKKFSGNITAFIVIDSQGRQEQVTVTPEGSVAQCIINETVNRRYPPTSSGFVAKASVQVKE
ncbi:hypothetical protein [Ferriphaselus amnicola]|nr:hypothetical protein [Ferriphaselus amnicola]